MSIYQTLVNKKILFLYVWHNQFVKNMQEELAVNLLMSTLLDVRSPLALAVERMSED